ncbi:MAG TPA: hypothetical protein VFI79_08430 [Gemmatimonadales bacterium]|nr:hypothetical protein [Gemmatimonadales bacterium]
MSLLEQLVQRWHWRWTMAALVAAVATATLAAVVALRLFDLPPVLPALSAAALVLGVARWRRPHVDTRVLARHLNRTIPAVEESADLLALPLEQLSPLERLQRTRVEARLGRLTELPRLPVRALTAAAWYGAAAVLVAALGFWWNPVRAAVSRTGANGSRSGPTPGGPPRITGVDVVVRPPIYTRHPPRTAHDWDLDLEQDGVVTWRLHTERPVERAYLLTTEGDTIRCAPHGQDEYEARVVPAHSLLYQAVVQDGQDGAVSVSDFHRLTIIPDESPTLTVVRPEPRTEIAYGAPLTVPVEVLAADDYAVAEAHLVATVTSGAGEAVKFRELTLDFDSIAARPAAHGLLLRRSLDLRAFGLAPGDELYFHVVALDNRAPHPNEGHSDTYFIVLTDTAHVTLADVSGLAVNGMPEYLRSERQIIIDTERLLADATHIATTEFKNRSESIGFDQGTLRDRYAEVAGQETVAQGIEPTIEHEHDVEENSTLLATRVKDQLQQAISQMFDAERHLRVGEPAAALPFEYRALELLKAAQEAARVYVLRVGFEPPPLEPDRTRLTGTLTGIGSSSSTRTVAAAATLPALRTALEILQRLTQGVPARAADVAALERAGRELGGLALTQPGQHLETLRQLHSLLTALADSAGRPCRDCLGPLERGLLLALPAADPAANAGNRSAGLARTYFNLLRGEGP